MTALQRFEAKYIVLDNGCWLWTASLNANGYGQFNGGDGRTKVAHRWRWELENGPVPDGLELDHLCRTRACVNPVHLEAVTRRVNLLRGRTVTARNAAVTHCPQGHPYDETNTYTAPGNRDRRCRRCAYERNRRVRLLGAAA